MKSSIVAVGDNGLCKGGKKEDFNYAIGYWCALRWFDLLLNVRKYTFKRTIVI